MAQAGLRQLAQLLEQEAPEGYQLVHINPAEIQKLTQVTGTNNFVPGVNIRKFAEGGSISPEDFKQNGGLAQYAQAVAQAGQHDDTQLAYVTPDQMSMLKSQGGAGTINPETGLPEYGLFGFLKKVFKVVAPIALAVFAPGIGTALGVSASVAGSAGFAGLVTAVGTTLINKAYGASWGSALKGGLISGVLAGVGTAAFKPGAGLWSSTAANTAAAGAAGAGAGANAAGQAGAATGNIAPLTGTQTAGMTTSPLNAISKAASAAGTPVVPPISAGSSVASQIPSSLPPLTGATESINASVAPSFIDKVSNFLTTPLAFKDATSTLGKVAGAATTPLGLGVLSYMMGEKPNGTKEDYNEYLKQRELSDEESNTAYLQALNQPPINRVQTSPYIGTDYGFKPESVFWKYGDDPSKKKRRGGPVRYADGGLAQLMQAQQPGAMSDQDRQAVAAMMPQPQAVPGPQVSPGPSVNPFQPPQGQMPQDLTLGGDPVPQAPMPQMLPGGMSNQDRSFIDDMANHLPSEFSGPVPSVPGAGGQDDVHQLHGPGPEGSALAPGEFVFDATSTADLGDGDTAEGQRRLEMLREYIRKKKGRKHQGKIPPKAGGMSDFLKAMELQ